MRHDNHARRGSRGFSLMELMITMVLVAVLTVIAVASYTHQVTKSRRADAKTALLDLAAREERYFTTNNTYTSVAANLGYTALPASIPGTGTSTYSISVTAANATSFTAQATRSALQARDECGDYTIDDRGTQNNIGNIITVANCW